MNAPVPMSFCHLVLSAPAVVHNSGALIWLLAPISKSISACDAAGTLISTVYLSRAFIEVGRRASPFGYCRPCQLVGLLNACSMLQTQSSATISRPFTRLLNWAL